MISTNHNPSSICSAWCASFIEVYPANTLSIFFIIRPLHCGGYQGFGPRTWPSIAQIFQRLEVTREENSCHDCKNSFAAFVHYIIRLPFASTTSHEIHVTICKQGKYKRDYAVHTRYNYAMQQERGRRHSRAQHLRGVFGPWWAIVNGIWALLSSADTLVGHYASVAARAKWDAAWIAPKWGWKAWLVGFCVITTVFGIEASYQFCKKWERDHYVPPELAIDIKELCVQPLIHFEQKQLRDWLTRWKIGASVADTMKPLLESGRQSVRTFSPLVVRSVCPLRCLCASEVNSRLFAT